MWRLPLLMLWASSRDPSPARGSYDCCTRTEGAIACVATGSVVAVVTFLTLDGKVGFVL